MKRPTGQADHLAHQGDETHLFREIIRTHQVLTHVFSRRVGQPQTRLALLRLIAIQEQQGIGVMDLARHLGVNSAAVTRQVQEMEAQNLILKQADPRDGRRFHLLLTDKGRAMFEEIHHRAHLFEKQLETRVKTQDLATTIRVLEELRTALEALL